MVGSVCSSYAQKTPLFGRYATLSGPIRIRSTNLTSQHTISADLIRIVKNIISARPGKSIGIWIVRSIGEHRHLYLCCFVPSLEVVRTWQVPPRIIHSINLKYCRCSKVLSFSSWACGPGNGAGAPYRPKNTGTSDIFQGLRRKYPAVVKKNPFGLGCCLCDYFWVLAFTMLFQLGSYLGMTCLKSLRFPLFFFASFKSR